jgi:hypothetical protein
MKRKMGDGIFLVIASAALLLLVIYALSFPMRHGARPWEAIAVLPQIVLWFLPLLFALPIILYFASRLRTRWVPRVVPRVEDASAGSLAALCDVIRASRSSHFARSRVTSQLVRLAVRIVAQRIDLPEEEAWQRFRGHCRASDPDVAHFLEREDPGAMSWAMFQSYLRKTVAYLEHESEEA